MQADPTAAKAGRDAAVDAVADQFNFAIRPFARSRITEKAWYCERYQIRVTEEIFSVQCGATPPLVLHFDPGQEPLTHGTDRSVVAHTTRLADRITVRFAADNGSREAIYIPTATGLRVELVMASEDLPGPVHWQVDYVRP